MTFNSAKQVRLVCYRTEQLHCLLFHLLCSFASPHINFLSGTGDRLRTFFPFRVNILQGPLIVQMLHFTLDDVAYFILNRSCVIGSFFVSTILFHEYGHHIDLCPIKSWTITARKWAVKSVPTINNSCYQLPSTFGAITRPQQLLFSL